MKTNNTHADQLSAIEAQIVSLINGLEDLNSIQIIDTLNGVREEIIRTEMMIRRDADMEEITADLTKATQWLIKAEAGPVIEDEPAPLIADPKPCDDAVAVASNEGEPLPPDALECRRAEIAVEGAEPLPDLACEYCGSIRHDAEDCAYDHN
jgi:hypothetical protein